jgi:hypothetical protein
VYYLCFPHHLQVVIDDMGSLQCRSQLLGLLPGVETGVILFEFLSGVQTTSHGIILELLAV